MIPPHRLIARQITVLWALLLAAPLAVADSPPALGLWWSADPSPSGIAGADSGFARVEATLPVGQPFDWDAFEPLLERLADDGKRIVLTLDGMPDPAQPEQVDAWTAFAREAVRRGGSRVAAIQVGSELEADDLTRYAFVLKATSLALRAEARAVGRSLPLVQATVPLAGLETQRALWELDVAPYIDILPLALRGREDGNALARLLGEWTLATLQHPPAPRLWVIAGAGSPADRVAAGLEALAAGAAVAFAETDRPDHDLETWIGRTHRMIAAQNYAPAPLGTASVVDAGRRPIPGGRPLLRLYDADVASTLVFYRAPGRRLASPTDRLLLPDRAMRETAIVDPLRDEADRVGSSANGAGRAVRIRRGDYPLVVRFVRPSGPLDLPPEAVETTQSREPTAEEILAQYRQVQRLHDDRLERYTARGRTDLHFKIGAGAATIDYSVEANYFWERGGRLEWEETDYFINGNRLGWKKIPEIPLIQAEQVVTLPLDLTLDRTYVYRKVGKDRVDGRDAWVLAFEPADPEAPLSLYRGRVWIDTETFARVKASLVQTRLEAPVLSNEEIDRFTVVAGPGGRPYRMLTRVDGQQIWNAGGHSFVVRRELRFTDFRINPPEEEFLANRERAYSGDNKMLRDTEDGFRYLDRADDGSREVRTDLDTSRLFLLAGAFKDNSSGGVVPLAGVNYLNFDLWNRGLQINAFLAGAVNFVTLSDPDAFGRQWDTTVNAGVSVIKFADRLFATDTELVLEQVDTRSQNVSFTLGIPVGKFVKFNTEGGARYVQYFENKGSAAALANFNGQPGNPQLQLMLPPDHIEYRTAAGIEYNRRGWTLAAGATIASRSEFSAFGLFDQMTGNHVVFDSTAGTYLPAAPAPVRTRFSRYNLSGSKEWLLPKFQKLRIEANLFDGSRLDRFSRWEFGLFGDTRLNGFAGSGVRFDDGRIARLGYSFNLFEAIRFDAAIESAWVNDPALGLTQNHGGAGVAANFVAPWKLVFSFSYGRALWSDVPELEGQDEFLFVVLRLF